MYLGSLSDFDEIVFLLLRQASPVPPDDLVGIVQHYLRTPVPRRHHADLLLVALARPEFDDALLEDVWDARPDAPLQLRGARLAGMAARPDADHVALLRGERSLTARLVAAELTLSPHLLAELVDKASPKLLAVAMQNPQRPDEVDLAAIDRLERPRGHCPRRLEGMLRRTPRVEDRVRASEDHTLRHLAWDWCDTPAERLAFAEREIAAAIEAGDSRRLIDQVLDSDEAGQLPSTLLRRLETLLDGALTARAGDDSYSAGWWRREEQKTLDQVRRILSTQADEPHPTVAVLQDRILYADYGEATERAEHRLLTEVAAFLGHGADFWRALAQGFDVDASIPDLVSLAQLLGGRPHAGRELSGVGATVHG